MAPQAAAERSRAHLLLGLFAVVLISAIAWLGWTSAIAYRELSAARVDLITAQKALRLSGSGQSAGLDADAATVALDRAARHSARAGRATDGPLWRAAAAIPTLGDTPETVTAIATSLDQVLRSLAPTAHHLQSLDPAKLIGSDGRINLEVLAGAAPVIRTAAEAIDAARTALASAPNRAKGNAVLPQVDDAATQLAVALGELTGSVTTARTVATLAPPILGADGPKRYFLAILNPNEARGTGGFLGMYAIVRAEAGQLTVEGIGSNRDLPSLPSTPKELGEQYTARYEAGRRLMPNLNLSPHFPAAARLWLESWRLRTGERLDGVFSADVVALGDLVTATGQRVAQPEGPSLSGSELTDFAISGIYQKFPSSGEVPARKAYQLAVTRQALATITQSRDRTALAAALGTALAQRRIQLWSASQDVQREILHSGLGGTLRAAAGHHMSFVAINSSASKLDAYLQRQLTYAVGRCSLAGTDLVRSRVTVKVTNAIPEAVSVPQYMIAQAQVGPNGPINSILAEMYLPMGAEVIDVSVDGHSSQYRPFVEEDRPAVLVPLTLPPRQSRTVTVEFLEPADEGAAHVSVQPLGAPQQTITTDAPCLAVAG